MYGGDRQLDESMLRCACAIEGPGIPKTELKSDLQAFLPGRGPSPRVFLEPAWACISFAPSPSGTADGLGGK